MNKAYLKLKDHFGSPKSGWGAYTKTDHQWGGFEDVEENQLTQEPAAGFSDERDEISRSIKAGNLLAARITINIWRKILNYTANSGLSLGLYT
jgi:hypothetical protein